MSSIIGVNAVVDEPPRGIVLVVGEVLGVFGVHPVPAEVTTEVHYGKIEIGGQALQPMVQVVQGAQSVREFVITMTVSPATG